MVPPMAGRRHDDVLFAVIVMLAIGLFVVHVATYGSYIADDAAITFAYAKNLARGHGLVLNPGSDPVEGYSNFAWLLLVLPFCARGTDPTVGIKLLSSVLGSLTLVCLAMAGRRIVRASRVEAHAWLPAAAAVGLAGCAPYVVWAAAGLENALYCAVFVAAILFYLDDSFVWCATMLVVLSLTRVEGVAIAGLFAVHRAGVLMFAGRKLSRREAAAVALFVSLYGGYAMWHWWYFRAILPNSYLAKSVVARSGVADAWETITRGWRYASDQVISPYRFLIAAPLAAVGLFGLRPRALGLISLLFAGVFSLVLLTGGDLYPQFRLGTLVLPLWFLLVAEGTRVILSRVRPPAVVMVIALVPIGIMCQPSISVAAAWGPGPISMGGLKPATADRFSQLAARIRNRPITVLESDIGNVAYFTDFAVLDIGGLANLQIARNGFYSPVFLHYVFEEMKPDIIHLRDIWAANAQVPIALMERDYQTIEGPSAGPYAVGWYVRRDLERPNGETRLIGNDAQGDRLYQDEFSVRWIERPGAVLRLKDAVTRSSFPSAASGAADVYAEVKRECAVANPSCHLNTALASAAQVRAESLRRAAQFTAAFEWYAAAWEADRRNVVALRERENMRSAIAERGRATACRFELDTTSAAVSGGGSTGTVTLTSDSRAASVHTCWWTAATRDPFVTIMSPARGTDPATIAYAVASNPGAPRTGTIALAGRTFTINQAASNGLNASFELFDPASQVGPTTECRFRSATGRATTCELRSTSSALGHGTIVNHAWRVVYAYDEVKTLTQSGASPTMNIVDRCGGLQSSPDGVSRALSVTLTVTDNLGATATAVLAGVQRPLTVRLYTCGS